VPGIRLNRQAIRQLSVLLTLHSYVYQVFLEAETNGLWPRSRVVQNRDDEGFSWYDLSLMVAQKAACENLVKEWRALSA